MDDPILKGEDVDEEARMFWALLHQERPDLVAEAEETHRTVKGAAEQKDQKEFFIALLATMFSLVRWSLNSYNFLLLH